MRPYFFWPSRDNVCWAPHAYIITIIEAPPLSTTSIRQYTISKSDICTIKSLIRKQALLSIVSRNVVVHCLLLIYKSQRQTYFLLAFSFLLKIDMCFLQTGCQQR